MTISSLNPDMSPCAEAMQGGMSDPVMQSQATFRAVMDAMAQPGAIIPLEACMAPPAPLCAGAAAIIATLADADTPLWLDRTLAAETRLLDWLTFQTGAPFAPESAEAAFAVFASGVALPSLEIFNPGLQDYPDRSTTLIIQVETLEEGDQWQLTGPGIKDSKGLSVGPVSPLFVSQWAANNGLFPRGIDVIFVSPAALACLPRTTRISVASKGDCQDVCSR